MLIDVVCALIVNDRREVLAAQRSASMDLPGKWEFPGGKMGPGETPRQALVREIQEELDLAITVQEELPASVHQYEKKSIRLIPFVCSILSGNISLKEHQAYGWFRHTDLAALDWAEADIPILRQYVNKHLGTT